MPVLALGVSYRHAPVALLERLAFAEEDYPKAYQRLTQLDGVEEAVLLSTCNRVEVYAEVPRYHQGFQDLKRFLSESREVPPDDFAEPLYSHYEDHAAEHLLSVAAGIDSMVLGEPQILSQVRAAFRRAEAEGAAGPALGALFRQAVRAGRRARTETAIGASPAAFVDAGAVLAAEHLGGLEGRSAVIVGAGKMGALAIRSLRARGVRDVLVVGRTSARAERLAARTGARHGALDELDRALRGADLVVSSTAAPGTVISRGAVQRAVAGRDRGMFLLDLAVPRDVEPGAGEVPGVRVADIDALRDVVADARREAEDAVARVREIVGEETARYAAQRRAARLAPLIEALHARGEEVRGTELRRAASRLAGLSEREREAVDAVTRAIVRKLLHHPVVRLKELAGRGPGDPVAQALADLFDLSVPED
ncbi:MAG TPA: glutamyl-tRNA reductase [Actinomycetota bacterium]|nr:glutamyl-tRNA reductase [Actinomycetota bacterium]